METVQQNGRFTLFSSKFPSNIYSILFASYPESIKSNRILTMLLLYNLFHMFQQIVHTLQMDGSVYITQCIVAVLNIQWTI